MSTIYASFVDAGAAERAAGALLDRGAVAEDISIVANEAYNSVRSVNAQAKAIDAENGAKMGLSTTTPGDVAVGAVKGATIGLSVGVAAVLASIFIPGVGLIIGGGALATALAGGAAATLAGAAAGGVTGYLIDQGVPSEVATNYSADFVAGGAILAIAIPTGDVPNGVVEETLVKYGAMNVATYNSPRYLDPATAPPKVPLMTSPNADPIAIPAEAVEMPRFVETHVTPTTVDPVTGAAVTTASIDPLTGLERPVAVDPVMGTAVVPAVSPITHPVTGVTVDPVTGLPINPVPASPGVVVDPVTAVARPATVVDGLTGQAVAPVESDVVIEDSEDAAVLRKDVNLY